MLKGEEILEYYTEVIYRLFIQWCSLDKKGIDYLSFGKTLQCKVFYGDWKSRFILPSDEAAEKRAEFSSSVKNRAQQGSSKIYFPLVAFQNPCISLS